MNYAGKRLRREKKKKPDQNAKKTKKLKNMCAVMADTDRYWPILRPIPMVSVVVSVGFGPIPKGQKNMFPDMTDTGRYQPIPRPIPGVTARNQPIPRPILKEQKNMLCGHGRYRPIQAETQTDTPAQKSVMKHFLHFSTSKPSQINQARPQTVGNYF